MMRLARTRTHTRTPTSRPAQYRELFPPKLAVASRRGDYKAPRFLSTLPFFLPPVRSDATHNTCIPYLFRTSSIARSVRARVSPFIQGESMIKLCLSSRRSSATAGVFAYFRIYRTIVSSGRSFATVAALARPFILGECYR